MLAAMARALSKDKSTHSLRALAVVMALVSATVLDATSHPAPDIGRIGQECVFLEGTIDPIQPGGPLATLTVSESAVNASPVAIAVATNSLPLCDSDGDQLPDSEEAALGTDPLIVDTDGDGLNDTAEFLGFGTSPLNSDSDGDGHSDGEEVGNGSDPNDPASPLPGE